MSFRPSSVTPRFFGVFSLDPSSVNANSTSKETFTVTGVDTEMFIHVQPEADLTAGLLLVGTRASAANVVTLTFYNTTNAAINLAATNFKVYAA